MPTSLDLELPDCLEVRSEGAVVVRGYRISLALIVEAWVEGRSVHEISERYPSLSPNDLRAVDEFCQRHPAAMRAFYDEQRRKDDAFFVDENRGPSLEQLQERLRTRRRVIGRG